MDNTYDIENVKILLNKEPSEFKNLFQKNSEDIIRYLKDKNIEDIVDYIKENELRDNKNILNNLLLLMPFSSSVIDAFIKSEYLEDKEFYQRVEMLNKITLSIVNTLEIQKRKIRNESKMQVNSGTIEDKLQDVLNEVDKHKIILLKLQQTKEKEKELGNVMEEVKRIKKELGSKQEIEDEIKAIKQKKSELDIISEEIKKSKELYKHLPKDEA